MHPRKCGRIDALGYRIVRSGRWRAFTLNSDISWQRSTFNERVAIRSIFAQRSSNAFPNASLRRRGSISFQLPVLPVQSDERYWASGKLIVVTVVPRVKGTNSCGAITSSVPPYSSSSFKATLKRGRDISLNDIPDDHPCRARTSKIIRPSLLRECRPIRSLNMHEKRYSAGGGFGKTANSFGNSMTLPRSISKVFAMTLEDAAGGRSSTEVNHSDNLGILLRNRIAIFVDPTLWRHRKPPLGGGGKPFHCWGLVAGRQAGWMAGAATPTSRDVTNQAGYVAEKRCHDDDRWRYHRRRRRRRWYQDDVIGEISLGMKQKDNEGRILDVRTRACVFATRSVVNAVEIAMGMTREWKRTRAGSRKIVQSGRSIRPPGATISAWYQSRRARDLPISFVARSAFPRSLPDHPSGILRSGIIRHNIQYI